jgi:hypothetical protein
VASSIRLAIFSLAQRAPTPAAFAAAAGVSATLQGWLPRMPLTTTVESGAVAAAATSTGSPR